MINTINDLLKKDTIYIDPLKISKVKTNSKESNFNHQQQNEIGTIQ